MSDKYWQTKSGRQKEAEKIGRQPKKWQTAKKVADKKWQTKSGRQKVADKKWQT